MSVQLKSLGVEVAGQVIRKHDGPSDTTTLLLTAEQARELYDQLGPVMDFFTAQVESLAKKSELP